MKFPYYVSPGFSLLLSWQVALCTSRPSVFLTEGRVPHITGIAPPKEVRRPASPSSLEAYCAQVDHHVSTCTADCSYVVGQPILANWLEFGVYYEGHVTGINPDGTYNVYYEDDMSERHVKPENMRPRKVGPKNVDPSKDPACSLKDVVEDLNDEINSASEEVARWLADRRKKRGSGRSGGSEPRFESSEEKHRNLLPGVPDLQTDSGEEATSTSSSDAVESQTAEGAGSGASSDEELEQVVKKVSGMDNDLEVLEKKRKKLKEKGDLDPELETAITESVAHQDAAKKGVKALQKAIVAEKKAEEDSTKAADKGAAEAVVAKADSIVEQAARSLQAGLREVKASAQKFESSVTPNDGKWWRYRYEYSMVEAGILLVIVPLMALYKALFREIRAVLRTRSNWVNDLQTLHISWLNYTTGDISVCFCVVITFWLASTFGCFDFLVYHIRDDDIHLPTRPDQYRSLAVNIAMQLGLSLVAYHSLIYTLVRATAAKFSRWKTYDDTAYRSEHANDALYSSQQSGGGSPSSMGKSQHLMRALRNVNPTLGPGEFEFSQFEQFFFKEMRTHYPNIKVELDQLARHWHKHTFGEYLNIAVCVYTHGMLEMRWRFWLAAWLTFFVFLLLHRFLHISYVGIMSFMSVFLIVTLGSMHLIAAHMNAQVHEWLENHPSEDEPKAEDDHEYSDAASQHDVPPGSEEADDDGDEDKEHAVKFHKPEPVTQALQFALFFMCYGFVRMVTAPWLWHIYFYNVLILTFVLVLGVIFFAVKVVQLIPMFYAAMAVPPYIAEVDVAMIVRAMRHQHEMPKQRRLHATLS